MKDGFGTEVFWKMKKALFAVFFVVLVAQAFAASFNLTKQTGAVADSGFSVTDLTQTPDRVYPGDDSRIRFMVGTTDPVGSPDVRINVLAPFISNQNYFSLGNLAAGELKPMTLSFNVPSDAKPGDYLAYVYASSGGAPQVLIARITITVNEPLLSNALIATVNSAQELYLGDSAQILIILDNAGKVAAEDVIVRMKFDSSSAFIPLGTDRAYISRIDANSSATTAFIVGVSSQASPGFYPVTLFISYKTDKTAQPEINQTFGFKVAAKNQMLVSMDRTSSSGAAASSTGAAGASGASSMVITVANVGDTAVRAVDISASSDGYSFAGASEKFIGTLNLDDTATMSITPIAKPGKQGAAGSIIVTVSYKDYLNVQHVEEHEFAPDQIGGGLAGNGNFTGTANQRFGRTQQQGQTVFGIPILYLAAGIVLAVAAFFGYKWYARRAKK